METQERETALSGRREGNTTEQKEPLSERKRTQQKKTRQGEERAGVRAKKPKNFSKGKAAGKSCLQI